MMKSRACAGRKSGQFEACAQLGSVIELVAASCGGNEIGFGESARSHILAVDPAPGGLACYNRVQ